MQQPAPHPHLNPATPPFTPRTGPPVTESVCIVFAKMLFTVYHSVYPRPTFAEPRAPTSKFKEGPNWFGIYKTFRLRTDLGGTI
jgi:hypothetical protein